MYFHASNTVGIEILEPRVSNHNKPLIYFSKKRENVLVYLSNAVEKYCRETGFSHSSKWHKWASYGFDADGILRYDEYYPDALRETYKGVSGYIYSAESLTAGEECVGIPDGAASALPVRTTGVEFVEDAFEEILEAEKAGLIRIRRFGDLDENMLLWIEKTIKNEYKNAENEPDYRHFLEGKFGFLSKR